MMSVGIRELRQRASELLRHVERGETIEITDRGRPVAVLSPVPTGSVYQRLVTEGEIARATRDSGEMPDPMPLQAGQESASSVLARLRSNER